MRRDGDIENGNAVRKVTRWISGKDDHARIFVALASVSTYILVAKIFAAAKEVIVANRYGVSATMDAYAYLFNLTNWPIVAAVNISTIALLPMLIRLGQKSQPGMRVFRSEFFGFCIQLALGAALLMGAVTVLMLHFNLPGFSTAALNTSWRVAGPMLLLVPVGIVNAFLSVRLMAQHRHGNSLFEAGPAVGIVVLILLWPSSSPWPLVIGTVGGMLLQMILLVAFQGEAVEPPSFRRRAENWGATMRALGIIAAGQIVLAMTDVIDQTMVAHLGIGSNATLSYANRLLSLALSLGGTAVTRALLPSLTELQGKGHAEVRRVALHWVGILFAAGVAVSVIGYVAAPTAISLLYLRGAFSPADAAAVTHVFRLGLVELPIYFASMVIVQLIASRADYIIFFISGILNVVVKVIANIIFIPRLGVAGVMLASATMYAVSVVALWLLSRRTMTETNP